MLHSVSVGGSTYDLFIQTAQNHVAAVGGEEFFLLPTGEKLPLQGVQETCGGGAANTSVGLARLGFKASYCGVISADQWGNYMLENFKKEHVNTDSITITESEISSFSIILSSTTGERTILYAAGSGRHLHDANFDKDAIAAADWLFYNHIQEQSCVIHDDIIELAQKDSLQITWNPGGYQLQMGTDDASMQALLKNTTLLQLNREEALRFTNCKNKLEALKTLVGFGVQNVCITDGQHGVIASDGKYVYSCSIIPTETVDATGAGDAFGTGTTWGLSQGLPLPDALKAGTINSASVVSHLGAQTGLLSQTNMESRLSATTLTVVQSSL